MGALALAAVGCSDTADTTGSDAKPSQSPSGPDAGDKFLAKVHARRFESWAESGPTDQELLELPPEWCQELKDGHSVDNLLGDNASAYPIGPGWGTERPEAEELLMLGVTTHCPELRDQVIKEMQQAGLY
ncbi:hypothetical protein [Streptomyces sp. NBC_00154]|uniref:hypothetical protein n=1 Tax=Streptomyces sp. NBC_00154 TaxID=2975670 RepID=UPI00225519FD|nr:hypothetical protein [Streptomyces sp. NBC_00154]MCX5309761.1 hypothetical protein [Streptomyces sp. NBC_00154]